jgi:polyferredoxin
MNPTKAAAILALIVTLVAVGFMCVTLYQEKVELKFALEAMGCASCVSGKEAVVANWRYVQSHIELLKAQGKDREALNFEREHAGERPINTDLPCPTCDLPGPDYTTPGAVAVVGLIVSLALFGAAKPRG